KVIIKDLKKEFVRDYITPAIYANALYEGKYYLATALSRPLIAKEVVRVAREENATFIAHGCTGKGNDQLRFELTFNLLGPELKVIAPLRQWPFKSREEEIDYCRKCNIPVEISKESPYSIDKNLWGISIECGILEDIKEAPPEDAYILTNSPDKAPSRPKMVEIEFKKGMPIKLDGKRLDGVSLINRLNEIGGECAIGRTDLIEDRAIGIKSREVYEAPAATILISAHKELESLTLDRETLQYKSLIEQKYAQLIYNGLFFTPLKEALDRFIDKTQEYVSGKIRLKLYKGNIQIISRESRDSLYSKKLATYSKEDTFNQKASEGFIKILGLPYKLTAKRRRDYRL
ncbi:MAG TPA: argininosuccinate synthase, partial [Candidatus Omnitrophica bacterium]|nr:argininosuccinate synthase [Candidatus Omnitrophota bacterium]